MTASADTESRAREVLQLALQTPLPPSGEVVRADTPAWDSLKHLNLVLALEEQFGVSLTEEQSVEILSYPLIKAVLGEHGIEFAA